MFSGHPGSFRFMSGSQMNWTKQENTECPWKRLHGNKLSENRNLLCALARSESMTRSPRQLGSNETLLKIGCGNVPARISFPEKASECLQETFVRTWMIVAAKRPQLLIQNRTAFCMSPRNLFSTKRIVALIFLSTPTKNVLKGTETISRWRWFRIYVGLRVEGLRFGRGSSHL